MKNVLNQAIFYEIQDAPLALNEVFNNTTWKILISESESEMDQSMELLDKIISALQLQKAVEVQIISLASNKDYSIVTSQRNLNIIAFGISPLQLKLQGYDQKYLVYQYHDNHLIFADSLSSYTNDGLKKILWNVLKNFKNENK